ncbi:MAG: PLP-dependent lyase/thiolase [Ilumatobacter sp.]
MHHVLGWQCAVCGARVGLEHPTPWRCPNSTATDRHHVLQATLTPAAARSADPAGDAISSSHPFIRHDRRLAWSAAAAARGMTDAARAALVSELDAAVRDVDDVGFVATPFERCDALSQALGFDGGGGVWVKDETGGVGGSQKARHLFSILLHLRSLELLGQLDTRPRLAIASCGNAALAAATLAKAADWPIDVFVPTWMADGFARRLDELGATTHRCERRAEDPAGDPAMLRFREAVDAGSVPFTVQGPENALCLDGGRTIGWEIAECHHDGTALDAVFVQVGGGAFAGSVGAGLIEAGSAARLMAVQAAGCAPLDRAWQLGATASDDWATVMAPWPDPASLADGILDDETYDWIAVLEAIRATHGDSIVAAESNIVRAHELAHEAGFDASPTGTASLAGLLEVLEREPAWTQRRVAVIISGVTR